MVLYQEHGQYFENALDLLPTDITAVDGAGFKPGSYITKHKPVIRF